MKNYKILLSLIFLILIGWESIGLSQARRVVGVIQFKNQGSSAYAWVARGIEEILYDKLKIISGVSVFERETLVRKLSELNVKTVTDFTPRKAFSIGKTTGIEILVVGDYTVNVNRLSVNFKLISTYTGTPILERNYSGDLSEIFVLFEKAVTDAMELMGISLSPEERSLLHRKPTQSIKAFEYYCKAYVEIGKGSNLEMIAGYFQRALQQDPNFWEAQYNIGVIYYNFNLFNKALQKFEAVIKKHPDFYKPYYGKGIIYYLQHKYTTAIGEFKRVLKLNPEHDRSYYYLGVVYTRLDSVTRALEYFKKSIARNPNYAPAYYQKGLANMKRRWYRKAIVDFNKALELNPDYAKAHNALGEAYYALNLFEEAIIEFKKVIKLRPRFATAYFNLGNAIYKKGALEEIVEAYWELLELQYVPAKEIPGLQINPGLRGLEMLREKSRSSSTEAIYRKMVNAYRTALKYDGNFYEASYNLALTYENLARLDSAEHFYKMSLAINPGLAQAHMRLGKLYERKEQYKLAFNEYKEVVKLEPDYFAANPRLGEPYRYINIIEVVLNDYQRRLNVNNKDKEALRVIGRIYYSLGRFGQAEEYYQQLVQLSPGDRSAKQTLLKIRRKLRKL